MKESTIRTIVTAVAIFLIVLTITTGVVISESYRNVEACQEVIAEHQNTLWRLQYAR
jgi:hypothetical protein